MLVTSPRTAAEMSRFAPFEAFLNAENEVLRCAAIAALPALGPAERKQVHLALLHARLDPDPDVRSDAMAALTQIAAQSDVTAIQHSLREDPVREVKLAAIDALVALRDKSCVPLLRALVASRSEDQVEWEDQNSDWEDWLDIQIAAIRALGRLGAVDAIDDLLDAWADEYGQSLDIPVFAAFSDMGTEGTAMLLSTLEIETGTARRRAAAALTKAAPEALNAHVPMMLEADDPALRLLAMGLLAPDDPRGIALTQGDADSGVRAAALQRFGLGRPELVETALRDADEGVRAAALAMLRYPLRDELAETLTDNVLAWLSLSGVTLATAAATALPQLASARAEAPLHAVIADEARPLDLRIAAVRALGAIDPPVETEVLVRLLSNPAQQVRAAALTCLRARAAAADDLAADAIAAAVAGALLAPEDAVIMRDAAAAEVDLGTPKEGSGPQRIRITRDGDIIEDDAEDAPESTLASILAGNDAPQESTLPMAEETPEEAGPKRRKRRAVEGPDTVAVSLARDAVQIAGGLEHPVVAAAVFAARDHETLDMQRAVWSALADHAMSDELCRAATQLAQDDDAVLRQSAYRILLRSPSEALLEAALGDADALIRAMGMAHVAPDRALDYLGDDAMAVRRAAIERIIAHDAPPVVRAAVNRLVDAERADTLSALIAASPIAWSHAHLTLGQSGDFARRAFILLKGFSGAVPRPT